MRTLKERSKQPHAAEAAVDRFSRAGVDEPGDARPRPTAERIRRSTGPRAAAPDAAAKPAARRVRAPKPFPVREPLPPRPAPVVELRRSFELRLGAKATPGALRKIDEAKRAFSAERFPEARKAITALGPLVDDVAEVRELRGLILYRLGRYAEAVHELEAFRRLAGSPEQNPVLADCHRALRRWDDVDALWEELREFSPSAALVNEGRVVMAGSLADRGRLPEAIKLLEKGWSRPDRPHDHHLSRAYALADLYERSGAAVKARELFAWIATADRDFADAGRRAAALR